MNTRTRIKTLILTSAILVLVCASTHLRADTGTCGGQMITIPFTDVSSSSIFFCSIAEAYFSGLTIGTTATTYNPSDPVSREQMAAFITRTLDQSLKRGNRKSALSQFWTTTPLYNFNLGVTNLGGVGDVKCDGTDLWIAEYATSHVSRVRASDGAGLSFWTTETALFPTAVLCAMGRVFVAGAGGGDGRLFMIDPTATPGAATLLTNMLGDVPRNIAFDGLRIWTANYNSLSIVTRTGIGTTPWVATNVGFDQPFGILYDGANIWVSGSQPNGTLKRLDSDGNVLQTVSLGGNPRSMVFDGQNVWVPNVTSNTLSVVRASNGTVLATLSGNGLSGPSAAAFDGERILVVNYDGDSVSLWHASSLTPLGSFSTGGGTVPAFACSDGQYFWISLYGTNQLARF